MAQRKAGLRVLTTLAIGVAMLTPAALPIAAAKVRPKAKTSAKPTPKPVATTPAPAPAAKPALVDDGLPHPKPVGNPGEWFPADAYPPEARNAGQEGRTVFAVKVDAQGRILECDIVQSSGSAQLDNTTCDLVVTHGRFTPAHDAAGKAVAGVWHSAMRWQLVSGPSALDTE